MTWLILATLVMSAAVVPLYRTRRMLAGLVGALPLLAAFVWLLTCLPAVSAGEVWVEEVAWVPGLGVDFALRLDGLSLLFALLATGIGVIVVPYAAGYLHGHPHGGRLLGTLMVFAAAMVGLVVSDDVITLFVFWESTSIASYLLIGFDHASAESRRAARQALLLTAGGGLALLAGLLMMGLATGTWRVSEMGNLAGAPGYGAMLGLVAAGAFTKSAQVPFHFWLPNAMAAPTPVSAYLHSATMVKAGVYLLLRLHPALGGTDLWTGLLGGAGALTALTGGVLALRCADLKRLLAWTTVSALGLSVLLAGIGTPDAMSAACGFVTVHALYKASLFLATGNVDHATGSRDLRTLRGLRGLRWSGGALALAGASMAALPPTLGFTVKEAMYAGAPGWSVPVLIGLGGLSIAAAAASCVTLFGPRVTAHDVHDPAMRFGPALLALTGLGFGFASTVVGPALIAPAASAAAGAPATAPLGLWHGVGAPLVLTGLTWLLGAAIAAGWWARRRGLLLAPPSRWDLGWDRALGGLNRLAAWQTRVLMGAGLVRELAIVATAAVGLPLALLLQHDLPALSSPGAWDWPLAGAAALILASAILCCISQSRSTGLLALGGVGVGVAVAFTFLGAPDLAMTQVVVEALVVLIALRLLGRIPPAQSRGGAGRHMAIAMVAAVSVMALMLSVLGLPGHSHVTDALAAASVPEGHGRNVVNVILVDFRAMDTLGEIAVLALSALGAVTLLATRVRGLEGRS